MPVDVRLQNVSKFFGETRAMDDVTIYVNKGELFFLLGPSGCGKTTCLRTLAGFYQPDKGELFFGEKLMNDVPPHKRNTGMVFQNYALWPHMTVYQNVEYGLNIRKLSDEVKRQKVSEVLDIVQMPDFGNRPVNQLSGGQQQRIALARALVIEPDVLLLDEPLSNLDAKLRLEMRQEIKRIHSEAGITTVYVTHDQSEALSLADKMAIMKEGKITQIGNPREIYQHPASKFVADFIGETNFIDGKILEIDGNSAKIESELGYIYSDRVDGQVNVGNKVSCSIRPESIDIYDKPSPDEVNQFQSQILYVTYLGSVEEYQLVVEDKLEVKMVLYNPGEKVRKPDDTVWISFSPNDLVVLPEK